MTEEQYCEFAFDRFIKQNDAFLWLSTEGKSDLACEMVLLGICASMILMEDESRESFFNDIQRLKETISKEIFEDEADFLECINSTMEKIREA